jgi:hypothetical protein
MQQPAWEARLPQHNGKEDDICQSQAEVPGKAICHPFSGQCAGSLGEDEKIDRNHAAAAGFERPGWLLWPGGQWELQGKFRLP